MKYQSLYDIYMDTVKKMANDKEYWKTFLEYASKMYGYKFSTLVTAFAQNPNYTKLVTYEQWNKLGYHIRKGEKSTPVLMDNHFKMSHMFDAGQLEKEIKIKNWAVEDTEREIFKERFLIKNEKLKNSSINSFEDIKAVKIVRSLDHIYNQPGNDKLCSMDNILYQSIDYLLNERCNLAEEVKIPDYDLSVEQMTAVGWCTITVARNILLESKEIVYEMRKEEQLHEQHRNELQGEGRGSLRSGGRGEEKQVQQATGAVRSDGKKALGEEQGTGTGESDNPGKDDGEDERDRKRDREKGNSLSNSDSETKSDADQGRSNKDVRAEGNTGSADVNIDRKEEVDEVNALHQNEKEVMANKIAEQVMRMQELENEEEYEPEM